MQAMRHDPIPALNHALACEGGCVYKLAAALEVAPSTVYRWLKSAPPIGKTNDLIRRYGRKKPKNPYDWKPKEQR